MERQFPVGLPYHPSQGVQRGNRPPRLSAADREASRLSPESSAAIPASQSSSSPDKGPISGEQVIRLVREAVLKAAATKKDEGDEAAAAPEESSSPRPGLTIDLSRRNISALPDEVVGILQNRLERLALNHNSISSFPVRFFEISSLRHLAARNNALTAFPLSLCDLKQLEYLDLGLNKIKTLPEEIANLTSLRAFAIYNNQIDYLPLSIANMSNLVRLDLEGNPLDLPPGTLEVPEGVEGAKASELRTANIKAFLKLEMIKTPPLLPLTVSAGDISDTTVIVDAETADTITTIVKRPAPGRFPIKANGASAPDVNSPGLKTFSKPTPHSQSLGGLRHGPIRRPGLISLTLQAGNVRPNMLFVPGHASRMDMSSADDRLSRQMISSPEEPSLQRPSYARQLASLPIQKSASDAGQPAPDIARGILYSILQVHLPVQTLMGLTNDGEAKRSSLEMVFYNTNMYMQELDQAIQQRDGAHGDATIHSAYMTLIHAYLHVCSRLAAHVDQIVDNGDRRYIRTFLMSLYHTIMELRVVATKHISPKTEGMVRESKPVQPRSRAPPVKPLDVVSLAHYKPSLQGQLSHQMKTSPSSVYSPGADPVARTPRSAILFPSSFSPSEPVEQPPAAFQSFLSEMDRTTDLILTLLPSMNAGFRGELREARANKSAPTIVTAREQLVARCAGVIQQGELLRSSLATILIQLSLGATPRFWALCNALFVAWAEFGNHVAQSPELESVRRQTATRESIRRIARDMKDSVHLMMLCRRDAVGADETPGLGQRTRGYGDINLTLTTNGPLSDTSATSVIMPTV